MIQQVIQRCKRVREVVDCQRENTTHRWARGFFPEGSGSNRLIPAKDRPQRKDQEAPVLAMVEAPLADDSSAFSS